LCKNYVSKTKNIVKSSWYVCSGLNNKLPADLSEALQIARNTREVLLSGKIPMENVLLGFFTATQILKKSEEMDWVKRELYSYEPEDELPEYRTNVYGNFKDIHDNRVDKNDEYVELRSHTFHSGVAKIEHMFARDKDPIHYGVSNSDRDRLKKLGLAYDGKITVAFPRSELGKILGAIKLETIKKLNEIINELTFGEVPEQIFENIRNEVDSKLLEICPKAIEKLPIIYSQLSSADSIVYSEIASTCRRIIKDVADELFPPLDDPVKGKDGKEHPVTDIAYVNRILARIEQTIESSSEKKFFHSMFDYVNAFLTAINDYASKGTHKDFKKTDAVRCIVYTYLVLGDILHYYIKTRQ